MILFHKTINGELQYRVGENGGDNTMQERTLTSEEKKKVLKFPIVSIGEELEFDYSILEVERIEKLEERKKEVITIIKTEADETRRTITMGASSEELAGWSMKGAIAQKIVNGEGTEMEIAILKREADLRGRGETPVELAEKQTAKAQRLLGAVAVIDGFTSRAITAIENAETIEWIETIVPTLEEQKNELITSILG